MKFIVVNRSSEDFTTLCDRCEKDIVPENLRKNGGTLNYKNLTYESDFLILCLDETKPVAFCSLVILDTVGLYVYQIAVKKEYQKKGIGSEMIGMTKQLASNLGINVSAHVMAYNKNSQQTFEKCGFIKNEEYSVEDEYYYQYHVLVKDIDKHEKGLS